MKPISILTKILLLAVLTTAFVACSKTNHKAQPQGGQDSGGGDTTKSSTMDVEYFYKKAIRDLPLTLGKMLDDSEIEKVKNPQVKTLLIEVSQKIYSVVKYTKGSNDIESTVAQFFKLSTINVDKNNSCKSVNRNHSAASIAKFEVGSPICISFPELLKLSRNSLEREIAGLLLHELLHSLNYDEDQAETLQSFFVRNFDRYFPLGVNVLINERKKGLENLFNDENFDDEMISGILKIGTDGQKVTLEDWDYLCKIKAMTMDVDNWSKHHVVLLEQVRHVLVKANQTTDADIDTKVSLISDYSDELNSYLSEITDLCQNRKNNTLDTKLKDSMKSALILTRKLFDMFYNNNELIAQYQ